MSIRYRLAAICLVIALLPAIPLSLLVRNLLEKSFNLGLSETVSDALESGIAVSRKHLEQLHADFEREACGVASLFPVSVPDSAGAAAIFRHDPSRPGIDGYIITENVMRHSGGGEPSRSHPRHLAEFSAHPVFVNLVESSVVVERRSPASKLKGLSFYETDNKSVQLALWRPPASGNGNLLLIYKRTDPEFLGHAEQLLSGSQIFAQLRLAQKKLSRSFFYPFIIIYGVILVLSLALSFTMAERMAAPIRRLVWATTAVAAGDWRIQLRHKAGGEIGHLIKGFNRMVSRLEVQRRRLMDMEKMAAWREMARYLAHEIKNPLLPIRLTVQEMKDQYAGGDEGYRRLLADSARVVEDELENLQELVKEFSSFATMPGLSPIPGRMDRLVADVAKLYTQADTKIEIEPGLPEFPFDKDQIRRVLINLFDNSLRAFPGEGRAEIRIGITYQDDNAVLLFSDNGPGIPAENLYRIFDPYFTTRSGGTGLGLALVKNIILLHGGTIDVRSRENDGAEFTITLPLAGPGAPGNSGENAKEHGDPDKTGACREDSTPDGEAGTRKDSRE